jgi:acetate kinase
MVLSNGRSSVLQVKLLNRRSIILTINAGSSSLKCALFDASTLMLLARCQIEPLGTGARLKLTVQDEVLRDDSCLEAAGENHDAILDAVMAAVENHFDRRDVVAVGHRVVHGGLHFAAPALVTHELVNALTDLVRLAPLHQPHNLALLGAAQNVFAGRPHVACFDTAFHRTHSFINDAYGLPRRFYDEGVRRYGFHGLSYAYVAGRLAEIAPDLAMGKIIVSHLGSGASICGLHRGISVATSMGFSVLDGLAMATRPGQLDPGVLLYLMDEKGLSRAEIQTLLYRESGLRGLSGISGDMRVLAASEEPQARDAIDYFVSRVCKEIGAMMATLEGVDGIVFCGGIGEHSAAVRQRVIDGFKWYGMDLQQEANSRHGTMISSDVSRVRVLVIPTDEELTIARHVKQVAVL